MKKLLAKACLLAAGVLTVATASAQMPGQIPPVPVDSAVRVGKLPNGLTYYIRHNETPKGQADFYIAQKVGSALEEEHQRGLAHFLEHMCFNGTQNFPGNQLIDWLESVGVKFGQNLNAYTGVDETVYNISNVPTARTGVQDSCLLILHDWADGLLLDPQEIDKERGVIHQEWRRSNVGQMRILETLLPTIYPNEKYGKRLPIGIMEVVDNFPPQALRDYYEAWYRPDQQGIIVVGDIDPDYIEGKIKEYFTPIKMPENAKERTYEPVADTPGTIYAIGKDPEMQFGIVSIDFKVDPLLPREYNNTVAYYPVHLMTDAVTSMLNQRISELTSKPDATISDGGVSFDDFILSKTKQSLHIAALPKDKDLPNALETVYRELMRAAKGGFTVSEYERFKSEYLSRIESAYNNRNNRQSGAYVNEYVRNFIDNTPIPSMEDRYEMIKAVVNALPLEQINAILPQLISSDNRVLMALYPDKEDYPDPTEAQFAEVIAKVDAEDLEPYRDEMKSEPLIPALPAPGKIVSEKEDSKWGATEFTLSNGVKVIVKQTKFKENEILFNASAKGGTSTISDELANDLSFLSSAVDASGLGTYTKIDMSKYLQGKQVYVSPSLGDYTRTMNGSTTVKDLPTLMELIYANFTEFNIAEDDFASAVANTVSQLKNQASNPQFAVNDNLLRTLFESPARHMPTPETVSAANRDNIIKIVRDSYANAADFTFVFVGNIDMATFRPLMEQYIATLPADPSKINDKVVFNPAREIRKGSATDTFTTKMETPQTYVGLVISAVEPYNAKTSFMPDIIGDVLSKRLLKTVREDMGAVYSIGASGGISAEDGVNTTIMSIFPMKPEMKKEVLDFIHNEIQAMTGNITDEEVNAIKEFMVKEAGEDAELNGPWLRAILRDRLYGVDNFNGRADIINSISIEDLENMLSDILKQNNYRVIITEPEESK